MVERTPTVTQSAGEDGVPHSSRSLHPPQSHARAKDLGEAGIGDRIPLVIWITPAGKVSVCIDLGSISVLIRKGQPQSLISGTWGLTE